MYSRILIPMALDHGFGETAIAIARKLLNDGGRITALHVYEAPSGTASAYIDDKVVAAAFQGVRDRFESRMSDIKGVEPVLIEGHSGRDIVSFAKDDGTDLIVMGSHKPGLADYFIGSTAARVMRHAPCAVHVLRHP